jgi:hypothetical protein
MPSAGLKIATGIVAVTLGLAGTGVMVAVSQEKPGAPPGGAAKAPPQVEVKEPFETAFPDIRSDTACPRFSGKNPIRKDTRDLLLRLAQERLELLVKTAELYQRLIVSGNWDVNSLFNLLNVRRDVVQAAADVFGMGEELAQWYTEWVALSKNLESALKARLENGTARLQDANQATAERFHAERELLKLMNRAKAPRGK